MLVQRRRRRRRWVSVAVAVVCLGLGAALVANVVLYDRHSTEAGKALVTRARHEIAQQLTLDAANCSTLPPGGKLRQGSLIGVIEIPRIKLTAPVVEGVAEKELSVAVGHLPTSVSPGAVGTSVLAAHDVTWFTHIDRLRPGDTFSLDHGCVHDTYRVTEHKVVKKGSPLYHATVRQVVLETCWPTDALYFTNERYLVFAELAGTSRGQAPRKDVGLDAGRSLVAPAVEDLAAQSYGAPEGSLTIKGTPAPAWGQSSKPLRFVSATKANYLAALEALTSGSRTSWRKVAGTQAFPALPNPKARTSVSGYQEALDITIDVTGDRVTSTSTHAVVLLDGQGVFDISTTQRTGGGLLHLVSWRMKALSVVTPSPTPSPSASATRTPTPKPSPKPTATKVVRSTPKPTPKPSATAASPPPSPSGSPPASPSESSSPSAAASAG